MPGSPSDEELADQFTAKEKRKDPRPPVDVAALVADFRKANHSVFSLGAKYDRRDETIRRILTKAGVKFPPSAEGHNPHLGKERGEPPPGFNEDAIAGMGWVRLQAKYQLPRSDIEWHRERAINAARGVDEVLLNPQPVSDLNGLLLRDFEKGASRAELSLRHHLSDQAVCRRLEKLDLDPDEAVTDRPVFTYFVEPYLKGASLADVCQSSQAEVGDVLELLAAEHVKLRKGAIATLSDEERLNLANRIRAQIGPRFSRDVICARYGISLEVLRTLLGT